MKGCENMAKANGQITILDLNDALISGTPPKNPVDGTLWIDESVTPNILKSWNGVAWVKQQLEIGSLDPNFHQDVENLKAFVTKASGDGYITDAEKLNIKMILVQITGDTLTGTSLPTLATIDTAKGGEAYLVRAEAFAAGIPKSHATYTDYEVAYNGLKTYLETLNPRPWKTGDTPVVDTTWTSKWDLYYEKMARLRVMTSEYLANAIKPGKAYNGVTLSTENGVVVLRGDNVIRTTMNATDGLSIEKNSSGTWTKVFGANADGTIFAKGLDISSDSKLNGSAVSTVVTNASTALSTANTLKNTTVPDIAKRVTDAETTLSVLPGQIESKVSQTEFENLAIGGRNLVRDSHFLSGKLNDWSTIYGTLSVSESVLVKTLTSDASAARMEVAVVLEKGTHTLTLNTRTPKGYRFSGWLNANNFTGNSYGVASTDDFRNDSITFDVVETGTVTIRMYYLSPAIGDTFEIDWWKIEKGNKATDWTPAPEDVDEKMALIDSRLGTAETAITQTSESIELKANSTDVYTIGQVDAAVGKKADQSSLNTTNSNLSDATQTANAAKTTADTLKNTTVPALTTRVETAESAITQTSKDIALRVTKTEFDSLEVGGRNLFEGGKLETYSGEGTNDEHMYYANIDHVFEKIEVGQQITISFDVQMVKGDRIQIYNSNHRGQFYFEGPSSIAFSPGTEKKRLFFTATVAENTNPPDSSGTDIEFYSTYGTSDWFTISNLKIEKGNKATDWTPAPEDVDANISSAVSTAKGEIKITTDAITQSVSGLTTKVDGHTTTIEQHDTSIDTLKDEILLKATKEEIVNKTLVVRYIKIKSNGSTVNTGNHIAELEAYSADGTNVALGKTEFLSSSSLSGATKLTDGNTHSDYYYSFGSGESWVQLDLGSAHTDLEYLNVWFYYADGRAYKEVDIEVSENGVTWDKVYTGDLKGTDKGFVVPINENQLVNRVNSAEAQISVQADQINLRVTKDDFDALKIGGRNLYSNSGSPYAGSYNYNPIKEIIDGVECLAWFHDRNILSISGSIEDLVEGEPYTFSFDAKATSEISLGSVYINAGNAGFLSSQLITTVWKRYSFTFVSANSDRPSVHMYPSITRNGVPAETFYLANWKLEKGDKATDWTPAPEDVDAEISALVTRVTSAESEIDQSSKEIALRVTKTEFDGLEIGGRNLFVDKLMLDYTNYELIGSYGYYEINNLVPNKLYTISVKEGFDENSITLPSSGNKALRINNVKENPASTGNILNVTTTGVSTWNRQITSSSEGLLFLVSYNNSLLSEINQILKLEKGNKATDWTPAPEDQSAEIAEKVSTAKSEIKITTDGISQTVSDISKTVTSQGNTLSSHTTAINQMDGAISLKADSTTVTTELGKKANQADLNTTNSNVTKAQNTANAASSTADTLKNTTVPALATRMQNAEQKITAEAITSTVTSSTSYKNDLNSKPDKQLPDTRSNNELPSWYFDNYPRQVISEFKYRTTLGISGDASYGVLTTRIPWTDSSGGVVTQEFISSDGSFRREGNSSDTAWLPWIEIESTAGSQKKIDDFKKATIDPIIGRVDSAEEKITDSAIVSTVTSSTSYRDGLTGKVSTNKVISEINQTSETVKISASKIDINGAVTFSSFDPTTQDKVNEGSAAKDSVDNNKATWDRAGNINTNGTFNTTKLNGTVSDAQVASGSKWNTSAADTSRWKMTGKTTIDGGTIETDTIKAAQIAGNQINANHLVANTITADKLDVLAKNLINNFSVTGVLDGYSIASAGTKTLVTNAERGRVLEIKNAGSRPTTFTSNRFEVDPNQSYKLNIGVYMPTNPAGSRNYFGVYAYDENGGNLGVYGMTQTSLSSSSSTNHYFWNDSGVKTSWYDMETYVMSAMTTDLKDLPELKNVSSACKMHPKTRYLSIRFYSGYYPTDEVAETAAYWYSPSVVPVNAGKITANQIDAGTITATNGIIASIDASKITTNTMHGDRITAGTIKTGHIDTDGLNAGVIKTGVINADLVTIANDKVKINSDGVTVKGAHFLVEDSKTGIKYSIDSKTNLVKDHSFEMIQWATVESDTPDELLTVDTSYDEVGWSGNEGRWIAVGGPYVRSKFMVYSGGDNSIMFGDQQGVVTNDRYFQQDIPVIPLSLAPYTISFYATQYLGASRTTGKPRITVEWSPGGDTTIVSSDIVDFPVPNNMWGEKSRYSATVYVPNTLTHYGEANMRLKIHTTKAGEWVEVDGVQVVEGTKPVVYDNESSLWDVVTGTQIASSIRSRNLNSNYLTTDQLTVWSDINGYGRIQATAGFETGSQIYGSAGGGLSLNNSDIIGINQMFMNDTATSDSEGMNWARSNTPAGSVTSTDYDTFRIYNGTGYLNSIPIFTSDTTEILWEGGVYMQETHIIYPSRKITDCPNGWVFVWSHYSGGVQNSHWNMVHVHKRFANLTGGGMWQILNGAGSVANPIDAHKYVYVSTDKIEGHTRNNDAGAVSQVLRYVLAY